MECFDTFAMMSTIGSVDISMLFQVLTAQVECFNTFAMMSTSGSVDISMLFQVLTAQVECFDTFFVQWALRCLPEDGKYKSVDISMPVDSNKVDAILQAFTQGTEITSR